MFHDSKQEERIILLSQANAQMQEDQSFEASFTDNAKLVPLMQSEKEMTNEDMQEVGFIQARIDMKIGEMMLSSKVKGGIYPNSLFTSKFLEDKTMMNSGRL